MLFNSLDFALFLPIVFIIYWFITKKNLSLQNAFILLASYFFYGWWDWRFLFLIILSTLVDYFVGIGLYSSNKESKRKLYLYISLFVNLGILGFFKYYNFFLDNFLLAFSFFGREIEGKHLNIILPVGISFYTFQTLSYTIDIYKKRIKPTKDLIAFSAFVSFFPQLVAGPIERANRFLPQFFQKRRFNYSQAVDGMRQILWGLFKKMVIADNCAVFSDEIFGNSELYPGSTLLIGTIFFTIQIYADFSGYSDIAIGTARLFGFSLMQNFAYPYFSRNFTEFWRRWHISLTTWFRDYLFLPLMKKGKINYWTKVRNIFLLFILIGLWHGANWTFIIWGVLHAVYFIPTIIKKKDTWLNNIPLPKIPDAIGIFITISLVALSLIFFRAANISEAMKILNEIFSYSLFEFPVFIDRKTALQILVISALFFIFEWKGKTGKHALAQLKTWKNHYRFTLYYSLVFAIFWFMVDRQEFIYFQF